MQGTRLLLLVVLLVGSGCYSYVPIESGAPPLGAEFRARLTVEGTARMAPVLGAQIAAVEGRVSSTNDSAYVVTVSATTNRANVQTFWTGESVMLPRGTIQTLEARKLDRKRTWIVTTLGVVGGFLAAQIFGLFEGSGTQDGGGPPPPPPA